MGTAENGNNQREWKYNEAEPKIENSNKPLGIGGIRINKVTPTKYPIPHSRTKRYESFLNYALAHYQK